MEGSRMPHATARVLALLCDPAQFFELRGLTPDSWQRTVLRSTSPRVLLNCCRQAGKSTVVAALALHAALTGPGQLVLLLSRAQRQSAELFRKVMDFYQALDRPVPAAAESALGLELANGSRIVSLPGQEENIRSFSGVNLLVLDEAARVPDELYKAVRPMLAVSGGRLVLLSTPFGKRGFFYEAWQDRKGGWEKFEVTAREVPRIAPAFLDEERRALGNTWFAQEYECRFEAHEGLVYPDFARCLVDDTPAGQGPFFVPDLSRPSGQRPDPRFAHREAVGGIDFGFRNPFAAVWGVHDRRDILWIIGEHYVARQTLAHHAAYLPKCVRWYADPSGAAEIMGLRLADYRVTPANNSLKAGIAAVTARLETGRLKVLAKSCPNLAAEAERYCYGPDGEEPLDRHNHALAALRYLIAELDQRYLARYRRTQ
jgi:hypothetical protein